jgi:hypothetical protein
MHCERYRMKHWKAYIKTTESGQLRQYTTVVDAENEFQATNKFKQKYGPDCLIGWIREVQLDGLQSAGY